MSALREGFENYILRDRGSEYLRRNDPSVDDEHDYADHFVQEAWEAWQAAKVAKPATWCEVKIGQHYCDSDGSIYRVFEISLIGKDQVQIGIEPTWRHSHARGWFTRPLLERIPGSVNVYDADEYEFSDLPSP